MTQVELSDKLLLETIEDLVRHVGKRVEKYGRGGYRNLHDALGKLTEEWFEVIEETQSENLPKLAEEYMDVAVVCVIAVASMVAGAQAQTSEATCTCGPNMGCHKCSKTTPTSVEDVAERARRLMMERQGIVAKSSIE